MKEKYLPIGSVCTLKGINKKIMITGFFGVSYNGTVKMYDYVGYEYPEGMLLQNRSYLFNHYNIESIDFMGYETEAHQIMNNNLLKKNTSPKKVEANGVFSNFKFDENGVVIFDGSVQETTPQVEEKKDTPNPFNEIYKKNTEEKKEDNTIFNQFKFDENGVVIAEEQPSSVSGFKFDENGVVIADDTITDTPSSEFQFDENGVVVGETTNTVSDNNSNVQFEEKPVSNYQFDENGVVVAEAA